MYSPLGNALVGSDDGSLYVNGVVLHPSQLHCLVQCSHYIQSIVSLYKETCTENVFTHNIIGRFEMPKF